MGIANKEYDVRYLTYWLIFDGNNDYWVRQIPFVNDLQFEMQNWKGIMRNPAVARELLVKGETHWVDINGVTHRLVIEKKKRKENWGLTNPEKMFKTQKTITRRKNV